MRGRRTRVEPAKRLTIGYCRVSTDEQAEHGVSLAAQEERVRAYAIAKEYMLDEVIVDAGVSAKTMKRPGAQRILAGICSGEIGAVVMLKLDRLTRSVRDLAEILDLSKKHEVALISVSESLDTSTAAGTLVVHMMGVVAQWERSVIAERTAFALAHKRRNGQVYGRTPFGYRREGDRLIPVPHLIEARDEARRMDNAGASLRAIGTHLQARVGGRWAANTVRVMLESLMAREAPPL
jgi:DNA invertase Pin-like site-specific DNA recombinase